MDAMESTSTTTTTTVGLHLLPSDLLYDIFSRLSAPDVLRLRTASKHLLCLLSSDPFCHLLSPQRHRPWLFLLHKRPPRHSLLLGFTPLSSHWFRFPISPLLPSTDLYLLAAAGDSFLFASNSLRELLSLNIRTRALVKIPPCPLGPRDTSSWRRSGLKLVPDGPLASGHFRFLFVELHRNRPYLFHYSSKSNTWEAREAIEAAALTSLENHKDRTFLSIAHLGTESLVVSGSNMTSPVIHRPIWTEPTDGLRVFGDGNMAVVRSEAWEAGRGRVVVGVELWELSGDGGEWIEVGRAPREVVEGAVRGRPYGALMGCVEEERERGVVTVVVVFNYRGAWGSMWVFYERGSGSWGWVPVVETGGGGLNMGGIALSSSSTIGFCSK